jgi:hypothetical protein
LAFLSTRKCTSVSHVSPTMHNNNSTTVVQETIYTSAAAAVAAAVDVAGIHGQMML